MKKDIAEKRLGAYPDVAADIINGILYDGHPTVHEENLKQISGVSHLPTAEKGFKELTRDLNFRDEEHGCCYVFYGIENQSEVDNTMPLRVAGYDIASYLKQVDEYQDKNKAERNPAYVKKLHDDQKLVPTVTLVLYYGKNWTGPKKLSDMLALTGREGVEPYLLDYRLNLVELGADKELYKRFHSDFRLIVQYLSIRDDKQALREFMRDDRKRIRHVSEFLDMMSSIGRDTDYKRIKNQVIEKEQEGEVTMCIIAQELIQEGKSLGLQLGENMKLISLICKKLEKNKSSEEIAEELEEETSVIEPICELAIRYKSEHGAFDVQEICESIVNNNEGLVN